MVAKKETLSKRKEEIMAEPTEPQVPKVVGDFNTRVVKMLQSLDPDDFLLVLSDPSGITRVSADQQQQQQQQQQRPR
jgi:hypothetical protein